MGEAAEPQDTDLSSLGIRDFILVYNVYNSLTNEDYYYY